MNLCLIILSLSFFAFACNGCSDDIVAPDSSCVPELFSKNPVNPIPYYRQENLYVSADGSKLAYLKRGGPIWYAHVLDIGTGEDIAYPQLFDIMPLQWGLMQATIIDWCPYSNNRVLVSCDAGVPDGKYTRTGSALFILSLDGTEFQRLPFSNCDSVFQLSQFCKWLPVSKPGDDVFEIGAISLTQSNKIKCNIGGEYHWQTNQFVPRSASDYSAFAISRKKTYALAAISRPPDQDVSDFYLNGKQVFFKGSDIISTAPGTFAFSPDESHLSFHVRENDYDSQSGKRRGAELWTFRVQDLLASSSGNEANPQRMINYRRDFCMYGTSSMDYITDTSFVVSMFKDTYTSYIYEISTEGKILRQLTTKP